MILKVQLEEARMEEVVRIQLKKNKENSKEIESEIVSLRKELKKTSIKLNGSLKFENIIEILDDIILFQRYPFIKNGLRYDATIASLPTPSLATTREFLFVVSGFQTSFL
jgi:hypothetical protein